MAKGPKQSGIQSIEVGFPLVAALADHDGPMSLSALASAARMNTSKAHKYLVSLSRVGLIEQEASRGEYDLGPMALRLGFAALRRLDVVALSNATMAALAKQLDQATCVTVWSNDGPTIVAWHESSRPVDITIRVGSRLPLLTSSNGRVFLAWLPEELTWPGVMRELGSPAVSALGIRTEAQVRDLGRSVRDAGFATVDGTVAAGIKSFSCPIFDFSGNLVAALAVTGTQDSMNRLGDEVLEALKKSASKLSGLLSGKTAA